MLELVIEIINIMFKGGEEIVAIVNISREDKEELPKYLYEYPTREMQLRVKSMSAREGMTIKEYITVALEDKLRESECEC